MEEALEEEAALEAVKEAARKQLMHKQVST
jgi:hypothetical protein